MVSKGFVDSELARASYKVMGARKKSANFFPKNYYRMDPILDPGFSVRSHST